MGNRKLGIGYGEIVQRLGPIPISNFLLPRKGVGNGEWRMENGK